VIFADLALARRLEAAEAAVGIACARAQAPAGAAIEALAGGWAVFVGAQSPLTHALGLGMNGPVTAAEVDAVEAFFRVRGATVNLDLCPYAHPSLVELLRGRGYGPVEFANVLVRPLAGELPWPPDARAGEAASGESELWARTVAAGFTERAEFTAEELDVGRAIFRAEGMSCYLGRREEGAPVAAAALAVKDGVATLLGDSTAPGFRGAGWQTALIRTRLDAAVLAGCDLATASTLPGSISQRNYQRAGFQVAYTRMVLAGSRTN